MVQLARYEGRVRSGTQCTKTMGVFMLKMVNSLEMVTAEP